MAGQPAGNESARSAARRWLAEALKLEFAALGWRRGLLGVVGIALIGLGSYTAWASGASTALLVVGAVVALLGLVPWRTIELRHGDTSALITNAVDALEDAHGVVEEVAQRPDLPEEARTELNKVGAELEEAVERVERPEPRVPTTTHHRLASGEVVLELNAVGSHMLDLATMRRYRCIVRAPDRREARAYGRRVGSILGGPVEAVYPDDFQPRHELPLVPGRYSVEWRREDSPVALLLTGDRLVARDRFVIRASETASVSKEQ